MTFTEILKSHGVEFRQFNDSPHVTHGWIGIICPFCGRGTSNFGMGYNLRRGNCSCWKCGSHRTGDVLAALTGLSVKECLDLLGGVDQEEGRRVERPRVAFKPPKGLLSELLPIHRKYLRSRNFDPDEIVKLWGVRSIGMAGRLAWRIYIPILLDGEVVSYTTRSRYETGLRYVTARDDESAVPPKQVLYGADHARGGITVHEGPIDAWRVGPGATCTLGVGYTKAQVLRMVDFPLRVVCFDSEAEAQRRARKLAGELSAFPGETLNVVLDCKDVAVAPRKDVTRLRRLIGV